MRDNCLDQAVFGLGALKELGRPKVKLRFQSKHFIFEKMKSNRCSIIRAADNQEAIVGFCKAEAEWKFDHAKTLDHGGWYVKCNVAPNMAFRGDQASSRIPSKAGVTFSGSVAESAS